MDGSKKLSMVLENLHFLDSLNYLPGGLKGMPKLFELTSKKGYYPHFFNRANNVEYEASHSETTFYGADFISGDERNLFSDWFEGVKDKLLTIERNCLLTA